MNKRPNLSLGLKLNVTKKDRLKSKVELGRSTKINVVDQNGEAKEYEISYDELRDCGIFVGRGTFGTVKKFYHKKSGINFAVKMVSDEISEAIDSRNADFMDLVIPLKTGDSCPYLVKFYGALHAEACIWIMTELMDTSLDRFYPKVFSLGLTMPELFISKVAFSILSALEFMRNLKVLHRDIKPSNVLLNATGEIKVCDFGIAGFADNSISKSNKGCQYYNSPEKIEISEGYSVKADIWSLGISLIEIATNKHPYKDHQLLKLYSAILNENSPGLDPHKFTPELCRFVDKCLIKNHHERPNCIQLLEEPFIKRYEAEPNYNDFIKSVIDELKNEPSNNVNTVS